MSQDQLHCTMEGTCFASDEECSGTPEMLSPVCSRSPGGVYAGCPTVHPIRSPTGCKRQPKFLEIPFPLSIVLQSCSVPANTDAMVRLVAGPCSVPENERYCPTGGLFYLSESQLCEHSPVLSAVLTSRVACESFSSCTTFTAGSSSCCTKEEDTTNTIISCASGNRSVKELSMEVHCREAVQIVVGMIVNPAKVMMAFRAAGEKQDEMFEAVQKETEEKSLHLKTPGGAEDNPYAGWRGMTLRHTARMQDFMDSPVWIDVMQMMDKYELNYVKEAVGMNLSSFDNPKEKHVKQCLQYGISQPLVKGWTSQILDMLVRGPTISGLGGVRVESRGGGDGLKVEDLDSATTRAVLHVAIARFRTVALKSCW